MADKKFYWLKLDRGFFKGHDIRIVEAMPNGKDYILFYLKLLCESVSHIGELRFSESIPYNEDMLSVITNTNVDIVRSAVNVFREFGMIEIWDDGTLYLREVEKMMGSAVDNSNANRQRAFKERRKALEALPERYSSVTENNAPVTLSNESKNKNKSKSIEKDIFVDFSAGDEEMLSLLKDFAEMRKKKGKPMTDRAKQMLINKLTSFPAGTRKKSLEAAIFHCWSSVYEYKGPAEKNAIQPVELSDGETDRILRLTREMSEGGS